MCLPGWERPAFFPPSQISPERNAIPMSSRTQVVVNNERMTKPPPAAPNRKEWRAVATALALSDRESEIVPRIFFGKTEAAIAQDLDLSKHTVHTHIKRLYRKLQINNRSELLGRLFASCLSIRGGETRSRRAVSSTRIPIMQSQTVPCLGDTCAGVT